MTKLVATSVVRGSQQGESHGGVFLIDFEQRDCQQVIDWNRGDIDWEGRGADRGLPLMLINSLPKSASESIDRVQIALAVSGGISRLT